MFSSLFLALLFLRCSAVPAGRAALFSRSLRANASLREAANVTEPGLTMSICRADECIGDRKCRRWVPVTNNGHVCGQDWVCICYPDDPPPCASSADCDKGEVCAESMYNVTPLCVWEQDVEQPVQGFTILLPEPVVGVPPSPSPSPVQRKGLSLDPCAADSDCTGGRLCAYFGMFRTPSEPCEGREPCMCMPETFTTCFGPTDCAAGEACMEVIVSTLAVCASELAEGVGVTPVKFEEEGGGLNFDSCDETKECMGVRICAQWGVFPELPECNEKRPCVCVPRSGLICKESIDCDVGEVCTKTRMFNNLVCVSSSVERTFSAFTQISAGTTPTPRSRPQASPSNSAKPKVAGDDGRADKSSDEGAACVDAGLLRGFERGELAFEEDLWAKVLCDGEGNCATEGHFVVVGEKGMMMRSYCRGRECVEREMFVNSPRYRRGLRVEGKSGDVVFTGFAARYETVVEERLLDMAVRVGF